MASVPTVGLPFLSLCSNGRHTRGSHCRQSPSSGLAITTFTSGGFGGAKQVVEAAGPVFGSRAALTSIPQSEDTFRCKAVSVGTL